MKEEFEFTPQERAAVLTWHLSQGGVLTVEQAAKMTGLQYSRSASKLLGRLSRVLPITCTEKGVWRVGVASKSGGILEEVFTDSGKGGFIGNESWKRWLSVSVNLEET